MGRVGAAQALRAPIPFVCLLYYGRTILMKLAVLGGGGVRSMFLAKSIAQRSEELSIDELVFMDIDTEKLSVYGAMAKHVAELINPDLRFSLTEDAAEAVRDADYVITTLRVGGDHMRVRDERLALSHGILGQETTGAAGISFAMRSIPALAAYCELIKKLSKPDVKVFNFTNPAGLVSQALRDMGYDFTYGICDAPSGMLRQFAKMFEVSPNELVGECYGLNHCSFFHSIKAAGREVLPEIIDNPLTYTDTDERFFTPELLRDRGGALNEYLYYYYFRDQAVANILRAPQTRGEVIEDINRAMTAELKQLDLENDFDHALRVFERWYGQRDHAYMANESGIAKPGGPWTFDVFSKDAGGYAGVALRFIEIAQSGTTQSMILCVPNEGAISCLEDRDIVEMTCDVSPDGVHAHALDDKMVPAGNLELIRRVKYYERTAARGIVNRSRTDIVDALTMHPLVQSYGIASVLADQYIELNRAYTGDWHA